MIRTLTQPRWLAALAAAAAFCVVCVFLGRWQWGRHLERSAFADAVTRNYAATPVPLDQALTSGARLSDEQLWTRVTATGTYDAANTLFVRNRPQNVTYGYEILVPLQLGDGTALLVDRGWVKNAQTASTLPEVPPAPAGRVSVTGWLRQPEAGLGRDLPQGQLASIDLSEAAQATGAPLRGGAYLVLEAEDDGSGRAPARPAPLLPPDTDTGPHFAYALQWWAGSIVGFVIVFVYVRREHQDGLIARGELVATAPRARKQRIWDEEDA